MTIVARVKPPAPDRPDLDQPVTLRLKAVENNERYAQWCWRWAIAGPHDFPLGTYTTQKLTPPRLEKPRRRPSNAYQLVTALRGGPPGIDEDINFDALVGQSIEAVLRRRSQRGFYRIAIASTPGADESYSLWYPDAGQNNNDEQKEEVA